MKDDQQKAKSSTTGLKGPKKPWSRLKTNSAKDLQFVEAMKSIANPE